GAGMVDCGGAPLPGSGGYRVPWRRQAAARLIAAQQPDVIEAGDPYRLAWAALDAARACAVPAVLFCHSDVAKLAVHAIERWGAIGPDATHSLALGAGERIGRYLARLCEAFDLVLAPSRSLQRRLIESGVRHALYQPLGVDTAVFHPGARDERWRAAQRLPADARVLLYAGRFAPEKNLPQLAAAIERLGPRYHLLALGSGPTPPCGQRVRILDFEPHPARVARAMASVDGFVHAGDQETCGLAVLEAMACGTPVAVRRAGGLAEAVDAGCGIAVDDGRPERWAAAIEALCATDPHMIASALHKARRHDWSRVLAKLQQRYARAIGQRRAAAVPWRGAAAA
ncbi:MAG TPA: glycosyltransferase, partial [Burkholderiaceae bacterium]|nr:glycosyltransferase [Burkholderiaceae bacterium]